jgi:hypothetical protein
VQTRLVAAETHTQRERERESVCVCGVLEIEVSIIPHATVAYNECTLNNMPSPDATRAVRETAPQQTPLPWLDHNPCKECRLQASDSKTAAHRVVSTCRSACVRVRVRVVMPWAVQLVQLPDCGKPSSSLGRFCRSPAASVALLGKSPRRLYACKTDKPAGHHRQSKDMSIVCDTH